jgi:hypothetical protein
MSQVARLGWALGFLETPHNKLRRDRAGGKSKIYKIGTLAQAALIVTGAEKHRRRFDNTAFFYI